MAPQATLTAPCSHASPAKKPLTEAPAPWRKPFESKRGTELFLCLLLALATVASYASILRNSFVSFDDQLYVTQNPAVLLGLSWRGFVWALRTTAVDYWHPVTWLVHMAAVQTFGLNPAGHHLISLLLHVFNVVFLFQLLRRATGSMWRSATVAALFALFPLNVESVAWVAETKTLLCTSFLLMALWAYGWYAQQPGIRRYMMVAGFFVLGLMAKPMVVTFPVALLLIDFWPLQRFGTRNEPALTGIPVASLGRLVLEKAPLLALSYACSRSTVNSQRVAGAVKIYPFYWRAKNSIWSYADYLYKGVWPTHLAAFYPYAGRTLSYFRFGLAVMTLVSISALVWRFGHRKYVAIGWLWYLITLLPVIGIIQSGSQGMADRYAYIPFLGIFVAGVWLLSDIAMAAHVPHSAVAALCACVFLAFGLVTFRQVRVWHDSLSLFSHMAKVVPQNGFAEEGLAQLLMDAGRPDEALPHYEAAVQYMPGFSLVHYNLGTVLQDEGRFAEAEREYRLAIGYETTASMRSTEFDNLGSTYVRMNRLSDALAAFSAAIRDDPKGTLAYKNRGLVEYFQKNTIAARDDFAAAVRLAPDPQTYYWLARIFEEEGDAKSAVENYKAALRLQPGLTDTEDRIARLTGK